MSKYNKNELNRLINIENLSYEEIGRMFNVTGAAIKKSAIRLGIDLPKRRKINESETFNAKPKATMVCENCGKEFYKYPSSKGRFCSNKCCAEHKTKEHYQRLIDGDETIMRANFSPGRYRKLIIEEQGGVCDICKCEPVHNGKELVFIIDHIDGDSSNNSRTNLRAICPNCDSQLDTYKSKNKNGARHYYRYKK